MISTCVNGNHEYLEAGVDLPVQGRVDEDVPGAGVDREPVTERLLWNSRN